MFFCAECDFKYDITRNIEQINPELAQSESAKNSAHFICNNCGYNDLIEPGTMIYSKTTEKVDLLSQKNKELLYDQTLPITRNYVCINNKCNTHKDPNNKEAVFYKHNNKITYICKICETDWDI